MPKNNPESSKNFSVTLDKNVTNIPVYDLFLIRGASDYMEIQLARKTETETEINVHVEHIFRIDKKAVPNFARQFSKYVREVITRQESQEKSDN